MANREALRDLQNRLAARLASARSEGVSSSWLAVEAGAVRYLFPLNQAGEIFPVPQVQAVPYTQPWFLGVSNLRGGLFGVVDLAGFVASTTQRQELDGSRAEQRVVALNALLEVNCALLIDRLAGLRNMEAFASSEPADAAAPGYFGNRYTDRDGVLWQEINLQALSQFPSFLSVSS